MEEEKNIIKLNPNKDLAIKILERIPIKGTQFAMFVRDDSMAPEYPAGSMIFIKKINEKSFIEWGRVYVLDTCNGKIIKKLEQSEDPSKYRCVSINPAYTRLMYL